MSWPSASRGTGCFCKMPWLLS